VSAASFLRRKKRCSSCQSLDPTLDTHHGLSCRDMVVIAAGETSEFAKRTLELDGWQVLPATTVQNPNMRDDGKYPARFWAVYTKIIVFNMLDYEKGAVLPRDDMIACMYVCAACEQAVLYKSARQGALPCM
jgi:hypothetical protein